MWWICHAGSAGNYRPANRNPDFEDMLRANHLTLEKVISRSHPVDWFHSLTRIVQGRRYRQEAYDAFDSVSHILLPWDQAAEFSTGSAPPQEP